MILQALSKYKMLAYSSSKNITLLELTTRNCCYGLSISPPINGKRLIPTLVGQVHKSGVASLHMEDILHVFMIIMLSLGIVFARWVRHSMGAKQVAEEEPNADSRLRRSSDNGRVMQRYVPK